MQYTKEYAVLDIQVGDFSRTATVHMKGYTVEMKLNIFSGVRLIMIFQDTSLLKNQIENQLKSFCNLYK